MGGVQMDDRGLIQRASGGDRDAFAALFDRHYEFMYRIAYHFTRNQADAEDIAQETSVKMARHLKSYRFEAKFSTWLYMLTINTAKDWARKAHRKYERAWPEDLDIAGTGPNPEKRLITADLLRAVEDLPKALREAVILVFRDGLSHGDAAVALGCAESTVSWRIHQARKVLSERTEEATSKEISHA